MADLSKDLVSVVPKGPFKEFAVTTITVSYTHLTLPTNREV